jgi:SAM-dependent methyltransferase
MNYAFSRIERCNMCGANKRGFRMLGLRLNRSQGSRPKMADGIAVSVKQCGACDLIFADPQPKPASLDDHYGMPPEAYWTADKFKLSEDYFAAEIAVAKRLLDFRPGMTALDVGAGLGKAMTVMQRAGFEAYGIKPSAPFREKAISSFDIDPSRLQHAAVEDAEFAPKTFDFITFGAVLEHLYDPARSIERCLAWLKPGGIIQAEVPSSKHLVAKLLNRFFALRSTNYVTNLSPMHPPYHLYEFGLRSFQMHAAQAGYEIAEHLYRVCSIRHIPRVLHPPLRWWMAHNDSGMQLTVYLRKPVG